MVTAEEAGERPRMVASRLHLAVFLWALMILAARGGASLQKLLATVPSADAFYHRLAWYYIWVIGFQWAMVCYVWFGLRRTGTPLSALIGGRWTSFWQVFRDLGIGIAFWFLFNLGVIGVSWLSGWQHQPRPEVIAMTPATGTLLALWLVMSLTAGFCEELVFRGYLQRQLMGMGGNVWFAIIGQGLVFGFGHTYEGLSGAIIITVMGILFGMLAAWRKSLRPGMVAHAWQDGFVGLMIYLARVAQAK